MRRCRSRASALPAGRPVSSSVPTANVARSAPARTALVASDAWAIASAEIVDADQLGAELAGDPHPGAAAAAGEVDELAVLAATASAAATARSPSSGTMLDGPDLARARRATR